jgi:anti-sigma B factor antagonist
VELRTEPQSDGVAVVSVSGDIDMSTAPQLGAQLTELGDNGTTSIVVDLSKVDFLDSSALGTLIGVQKQLKAVGGSLKLACSHPKIERVFAITRLTEVIPVFTSVAEAKGPT